MIIKNPIQQELSAPVLIDRAFDIMGDKLKDELSWLTNVYGRAERIPSTDDLGRVLHEPLVYVGRDDNPNDYLNMLPDANLGNHMFFYVRDGEKVKWDFNGATNTASEFSMIFWWDYRIVYPQDHLTKTLYNVINDIYTALATIKHPNFSIKETYSEARNIYRDFNYQGNRGQKVNQQFPDQFMMRPYGGVRIEGDIYIKHGC